MCVLCWKISGVCKPLPGCPAEINSEVIQRLNNALTRISELEEKIKHILDKKIDGIER